jgi:hypothetical protein
MNKILTAFGALAVAVALVPDEASAQRIGFGRGVGGVGALRGGVAGPVGGFHGGAFRGGIARPVPGMGAFRGGSFGVRPGFGYRPAAIARPALGRYGAGFPGFYGRRYGAYRPVYGGSYRYRSPSYGRALTAGLIGGLALGSVGYHGYGYPSSYPYGSPYYGVGYGEDCYLVRRRFIGPRGGVVIRRTWVCEF